MGGFNDDLERLRQQSQMFKKLAASKTIPSNGEKRTPIPEGKTIGKYTVNHADPDGHYQWIKADSSQVTPADSTDFANNFASKYTGKHDLMSYDKEPPPQAPKLMDSVFHAFRPSEVQMKEGGFKVPNGKLICKDGKCNIQGNDQQTTDMAQKNMTPQEKQMFGTPTSRQSKLMQDPKGGYKVSDEGHTGMTYIKPQDSHTYTQGAEGYGVDKRNGNVANPNASTADFYLRGQQQELLDSGKANPQDLANAYKKTNPNFNEAEFLQGFQREQIADTTRPETNRLYNQQQMDNLRKIGQAGNYEVKGYANQKEAESDISNKKLQELLMKRKNNK